MKSTAIVIPVRLASTRFPNKPLAIIDGMTMLERTIRQAMRVRRSDVYVAYSQTDMSEVVKVCREVGVPCIPTPDEYTTGTSRARYCLDSSLFGYKSVIVWQVDEPFVDPLEVEGMIVLCEVSDAEVVTLVGDLDQHHFYDPNTVKCLIRNSECQDFSRKVVWQIDDKHDRVLGHVGVYGFKVGMMRKYVTRNQSPRAIAESLEQLSWIDRGAKITPCRVREFPISINTPKDLEALQS